MAAKPHRHGKVMIRKIFSSSQELRDYLAGNHPPRYALSFFPEAPPLGETIYFSDNRQELLEKAIGFAENRIGLIEISMGVWSALNLDFPLPCFFAASQAEAWDIFWQEMTEAVRGQGFEAILFEDDRLSLANYLREWQVLESVRIKSACHYH